jgi:hypothetical protein
MAWLNGPIGLPWQGEQLTPAAFMYIVQDDPSISIWVGTNNTMTLLPFYRTCNHQLPLSDLHHTVIKQSVTKSDTLTEKRYITMITHICSV